jgi:integrase
MSRLRRALERYVGMRQGLGYKYDSPARRLSDFVSFMEARGAETITVALAMEWVTKIGRQPTWAIRLTDVRCFAQHLAHFDPLTEVPPTDLVPAGRRAMPYIYSDAEIKALVAAALALPPANALRRWTYHCLFGLIAVAGLRHSEALNLHCDDVDLDQGVLTIREQVRQVAVGAASRHHHFGAQGLFGASGRTSRSAPKPLFLRSRTRRPSAASVRPPRLLAIVAADRASAEGAAQRSPRS